MTQEEETIKETAKEATEPAANAPSTAGKPKRKRKKKGAVSLTKAIICINCSYNNTIITITDSTGKVVSWYSAGRAGFKGPKKSTPYAAGAVVRKLADFVKASGLQKADIIVQGIGMGRDASIRAISGLGIQVLSIKDRTPVPHNGPRPKKPRRI